MPLCVHNPNQKAFVTVVSLLQFYVAVKAISSLNTFFLLLPSEQIIMFLLDIKLQNTGQDIVKDTVALVLQKDSLCKRIQTVTKSSEIVKTKVVSSFL